MCDEHAAGSASHKPRLSPRSGPPGYTATPCHHHLRRLLLLLLLLLVVDYGTHHTGHHSVARSLCVCVCVWQRDRAETGRLVVLVAWQSVLLERGDCCLVPRVSLCVTLGGSAVRCLLLGDWAAGSQLEPHWRWCRTG